MEARGKYDFNGSAEDELSFRKGDVLKILGTQDDWLKAEMHGHEGFVPKNYVDMPIPSWFQENASRSAAEEILRDREVGGFLIRGSQSSPGDFSISVRHDSDVQHFKVMKDNKGHYYLWSEKFTSLNKLVGYYKKTSISKQMDIYLSDGTRDERRSSAPHPVKRNDRPQPPGYGGGPASTGHTRSTDMTDTPGKRPSLEDRAHTIGATGRSSPVNNAPAARRHSEIPAPRPNSQVRALFDFTAEESDELGFNEGDIIEILDRSDASWWKGRLRGKTGLFPANYTVQI